MAVTEPTGRGIGTWFSVRRSRKVNNLGSDKCVSRPMKASVGFACAIEEMVIRRIAIDYPAAHIRRSMQLQGRAPTP